MILGAFPLCPVPHVKSHLPSLFNYGFHAILFKDWHVWPQLDWYSAFSEFKMELHIPSLLLAFITVSSRQNWSWRFAFLVSVRAHSFESIPSWLKGRTFRPILAPQGKTTRCLNKGVWSLALQRPVNRKFWPMAWLAGVLRFKELTTLAASLYHTSLEPSPFLGVYMDKE